MHLTILNKIIPTEMKTYLDINPEIQDALRNHQPIVALESTIISHGMPFPQNMETALMLEHEVRKYGAIPATIALINGIIKIGLTEGEIEFLAREGLKVHKTSRRDLAFVLSKKLTGATTVAATMIAAEMAGIRVFATGGIGGVHRDATETFDISADLLELSQTPVAVVCAGVKSILDIGLTLEYLETMGVPILGYQSDDMPAFYTSKSGFKVDFNMQTTEEIAHFIHIQNEMSLKNGILITQAIPKAYDMDPFIIDVAIEKALTLQKELGIKGKNTTPFLLAKVKEFTGGESLISNIALVQNNARLAAEIAVSLSKINLTSSN